MTSDSWLRRWRLPLTAAIFCAGALLYSVSSSGASAGTSIGVGGGSAAPGGSISSPVTVGLAPNDTVNGFDVTIGYNSAVVTANSVSLGAGWVQGGNVTTTINNAAGSVRVQGFQLGTGCSISPCALFTVNWNAVASGTTQASVSAQQLSGSNGGAAGQITGVGSSPGNLTVTGGQSTPPTSTATSVPPTATNTPLPPTATQTNAPNTPAATTAAPTNTPVPAATSTPAQPTTAPTQPAATSTPAAQPTSNPVVIAPGPQDPPSPNSPSVQGPLPAPSVNAPANPSVNNPSSGPAPSVGGNAPSSSDGNGGVRFIPLPPRTGTGTVGEGGTPLTGRIGLALMAVSGLMATWSLVTRRKPATVGGGRDDVVGRYLDDAERRGRKL